MPLDPQIRAILDQMASLPPFESLSVEDARKQTIERSAAGKLPTLPVAAVVNRVIPGPGGDLPVRIYTPKGKGPFPLMVFFHGSGFVVCNLDTHDGTARNLCSAGGCVVVSVDYRLAPEHKFPAGPEDCYAATKWAAAHAVELNADASRLVIAGESIPFACLPCCWAPPLWRRRSGPGHSRPRRRARPHPRTTRATRLRRQRRQ